MSGPVKLPENLRQPPERYLRDIAVGETVLVSFISMQPDAEGNCFLNPGGKIVINPLLTVKVERRADGYHVTAPADVHWTFGDFKTDSWYPVASITVAGDRWGVDG